MTHARLPYARRTPSVRLPWQSVLGAGIYNSYIPCDYLGSALVFVKNLRSLQGRSKATVCHHFKGRTAAACFLSPHIQNTPCSCPNICDCYSMWPCCGGPIIAIDRRYFRSHGRRGKCDWGITSYKLINYYPESSFRMWISTVSFWWGYFAHRQIAQTLSKATSGFRD